MTYECSCCHCEVYIPHASAWPEQCPHCRTWHPGFQSPGFQRTGTYLDDPGMRSAHVQGVHHG